MAQYAQHILKLNDILLLLEIMEVVAHVRNAHWHWRCVCSGVEHLVHGYLTIEPVEVKVAS